MDKATGLLDLEELLVSIGRDLALFMELSEGEGGGEETVVELAVSLMELSERAEKDGLPKEGGPWLTREEMASLPSFYRELSAEVARLRDRSHLLFCRDLNGRELFLATRICSGLSVAAIYLGRFSNQV